MKRLAEEPATIARRISEYDHPPKWAMDLCDVMCLRLMDLRATHNLENYERISYIRLTWNRINFTPSFISLEGADYGLILSNRRRDTFGTCEHSPVKRSVIYKSYKKE